jgi:Domain of unknown function (DUF4159)
VTGRRWVRCLALLAALAAPATVFAQRGLFGFGPRFGQYENVAYDGRFTFVRVRYRAYGGWRADYPTMEENLTGILQDITAVRGHVRRSNVLDFDDPELLRYPMAYLSEPGYWFPTDEEVEGLRHYLAKGGFLIVDDFHFPEEWAVFERAIRRVLPGGQIKPLELSHPIFNTFFQIKSLEVPYPGRLGEMGLMGEFSGIYRDNDPRRDLMVVINYNIDLGDYVEWSGREDVYALVPTNEAYKFLINYVVYGLTH